MNESQRFDNVADGGVEQSVLCTRSLSIGYGDARIRTTVACGLNLDLRRGALVCLLGANGVGKSTLIRTLAGFQSPVAGDILVDGAGIGSYSGKQLSKLVSVVLTERNAVENLSVGEVVAMGRYPYIDMFCRLSADDVAIVDESLDKVGALALKSKMMDEISDGERQRVMIAKALAQKTPVMILDEPTAFLDLPGRVAVMSLLCDLAHSEHIAVLQSTHDLEQAVRFSDSLWLMHAGGRMSVGAPEDLVLRGDMSEMFDTSGLEFDSQSGTFVSSRKCVGSVRVCGSGLEYAWLCKALNRVGYEVGDDAERSVSIVRDGGVYYCVGDKRFSSIAQLLAYLV